MADPTEALTNAYDGVDEALNMLEQVPDDDGSDAAALNEMAVQLFVIRGAISALIEHRQQGGEEQ
ncbi:hypothetical protein [uncultured Tateyamaria sp.]|uniref:hypothetical protein n=1 Tax=uncultured Tateyamaria sp. TaxID=455651 RepID=UPI00260583D2|nr:hypothetical protein [uncultured Tateyamaria sp.]